MSTLAPTRPDTLGPYFPPSFADGEMLDLLRPGASAYDAIAIDIRVLDRDGSGATNLLAEAWQPDGAGRRPGLDAGADPRLASIGRLLSRTGCFRVRTIRPSGGRDRAGWIALALYSDGLERLTTEIFLVDDARLASDPLIRSMPAERSDRLVARMTAAGTYAIDIQLSDASETPFLTARSADAAESLRPYPGDNTSVERTPLQPPVTVPDGVAASLQPWIEDADLPRGAPSGDWVGDGSARPIARGQAIEIVGQVLDERGRPLPGVAIEFWAANSEGRYRHPDDHTDPPLDPGYDGIGRLRTGADGGYRLRLIAPGAYLARPDIGRWRPGHVHASLIGGGDVRLVTQLYFPDDPHHAPDPMRIAHGEAFSRQLLQPDAAAPHRYRYDFVIDRGA